MSQPGEFPFFWLYVNFTGAVWPICPLPIIQSYLVIGAQALAYFLLFVFSRIVIFMRNNVLIGPLGHLFFMGFITVFFFYKISIFFVYLVAFTWYLLWTCLWLGLLFVIIYASFLPLSKFINSFDCSKLGKAIHDCLNNRESIGKYVRFGSR